MVDLLGSLLPLSYTAPQVQSVLGGVLLSWRCDPWGTAPTESCYPTGSSPSVWCNVGHSPEACAPSGYYP